MPSSGYCSDHNHELRNCSYLYWAATRLPLSAISHRWKRDLQGSTPLAVNSRIGGVMVFSCVPLVGQPALLSVSCLRRKEEGAGLQRGWD